jgi:CheY-specific phosphatase CheX
MADLSVLLTQATEEVLENMFFSGVMGEMETTEATADGDRLFATVTFAGSVAGQLTVSAAPATVAVLAAGFLGAEDDSVADTQARSVVGELANVLCGVMLGHLDPKGSFVISPPDVTGADGADGVGAMELHKWFELMEGDLAVGLTVH